MRLIVGEGSIGRRLSSYWQEKDIAHDVSTRNPSRVVSNNPFIDLSAEADFSFDNHYEVAVLCAGNSDMLECKTDPIGTRKINVEGTVKLARYLETTGTHIIFISSEKVYSGSNPHRSPNDKTNPLTDYGKQKERTEEDILILKNSTILRLTKVIDPSEALLRGWFTKLSLGQTITAFSDLCFAPISMYFVCTLIEGLIAQKVTGIWHGSATHEISYHFAAEHLAACFEVDRDVIEVTSAACLSLYDSEEIPIYTSLNMEKTQSLGLTVEDPIDVIHANICNMNLTS